jgi:hypothetical protein
MITGRAINSIFAEDKNPRRNRLPITSNKIATDEKTIFTLKLNLCFRKVNIMANVRRPICNNEIIEEPNQNQLKEIKMIAGTEIAAANTRTKSAI